MLEKTILLMYGIQNSNYSEIKTEQNVTNAVNASFGKNALAIATIYGSKQRKNLKYAILKS